MTAPLTCGMHNVWPVCKRWDAVSIRTFLNIGQAIEVIATETGEPLTCPNTNIVAPCSS
jgi:hypothetical protein